MLVDNKGFTLIELLVVIAVLGILAAIAIPRLSGVTDKARDAEYTSTAGTIRSAMEMYLTEYGDYPGDGASGDDTFAAVGSWATLNDALETVELPTLDGFSFDSYSVDSDGATDEYTLTISNTQTGSQFVISEEGVN